jgi:asparagine synthase (glutamine-hydrolysing)
MCGIIGSLGPQFSKKDVQQGLDTIQHRGQDERTFVQVAEDVFFGMNRLSIQDLTPNLYPFRYQHYWLIFNGEIYNHAELKKLLAQKGYKCKTTCDAEVILPLFKFFGIQGLKKLNGMFTIAIYDEQTKDLYLARDLFGEKPLYYTQHGSSVFFASELKAFPINIKKLSSTAIPEFLSFGFINGRRTFFEKIYKVQPGECIQFHLSQNRSHFFDHLSNHLAKTKDLERLTEDELVEKLALQLPQIIERKLCGESSIGLFLSGGLDSSLLAAVAQKISAQPIFTYSMGFSQTNQDESTDALHVARAIGTTHHHQTFSLKEVAPVWQDMLEQLDEPIADPAFLPTFLLAKRAQKDVKVVLTGEGADEIFSGYQRYQRFKATAFLHQTSIAALLQKISATPLNAYKLFAHPDTGYSPVSYPLLWKLSDQRRKKYLEVVQQVWQETVQQEADIQTLKTPFNLQLHDLRHYVPEQLCMKTDKILMRYGIESRAPYLDKSLLYFLNFPQTDKRLLRRVAEQYLPPEICNKKKHGFSIPLQQLFTTILKKPVTQLYSPHPFIKDWVTQSEIRAVLSNWDPQDNATQNTVWNLIVLNTWLKKHVGS